MAEHKNHKYTEIKKGKTEGHLEYKDMMCPECGAMMRMREDGKMEKMKDGKMME